MNAQEPRRDCNDKQLRVEFIDGVSAEVFVAMVSNSHCHEECDGIIYEVLSSSRPGWTKTDETSWAEMEYAKSLVPFGESNS